MPSSRPDCSCTQRFETLTPGSRHQRPTPDSEYTLVPSPCFRGEGQDLGRFATRTTDICSKTCLKTRLTWLHIDEIRPTTEITITSVQSYEAAELQQLPTTDEPPAPKEGGAPTTGELQQTRVSISQPAATYKKHQPVQSLSCASSSILSFLPPRLVAAHSL